MKANPETVKAWKQANPDRERVHRRTYYLKHKVKIMEKRREKRILYMEPI